MTSPRHLDPVTAQMAAIPRTPRHAAPEPRVARPRVVARPGFWARLWTWMKG